MPPAVIRTYLPALKITENSAQPESERRNEHISAYTNKSAEKDCAAALGLTDEQIAKIDELMAIRKPGIQGEMRYALAHAKRTALISPRKSHPANRFSPDSAESFWTKS